MDLEVPVEKIFRVGVGRICLACGNLVDGELDDSIVSNWIKKDSMVFEESIRSKCLQTSGSRVLLETIVDFQEVICQGQEFGQSSSSSVSPTVNLMALNVIYLRQKRSQK